MMIRTLWLLLALLLAGCGAGASQGAPGGIHARLAYSEGGGLRIVATPEGGAAAKSGLQEGDKIIGIDGAPVREFDYVELVERLRGKAGTPVELEIVRDQQSQRIVVMRQPYEPR
jgi:C-terminal processing protease CtpA/Prc